MERIRPDVLWLDPYGTLFAVEDDCEGHTRRSKYNGVTFFANVLWVKWDRKPLHIRICPVCGKEFEIKSPKYPDKYCGQACYGKSMEGKVPIDAMVARGYDAEQVCTMTKPPLPPTIEKGDVMVSWIWPNPRQDVKQFGKLTAIQRNGRMISAEYSINTRGGRKRWKTTWVLAVRPKTTFDSLLKRMQRMYGRGPSAIGVFKFDGRRFKSLMRKGNVRIKKWRIPAEV